MYSIRIFFQQALFFSLITITGCNVSNKVSEESLKFYAPDNNLIQYTGRIDFTDPKAPRFWQPGVYIDFKFSGTKCKIIVKDEVLWGKNHNYYELVIDDKAHRFQTKSATDTIDISQYLSNEKEHSVKLVKNTEANIGYMELTGIICKQLLQPAKKPVRKIEFIGNSITCAAGSDISEVPCGKGEWHDQHNAWMSYAAVASRTLNAQYHLSSVSGIGLMRSCCNMDIIMPQVYDKVSMRDNKISWDFNKYQPDVVSVCLGQNDGVQDSTTFCNNYIQFLKTLRGYYPPADFILLSSPMADDKLREFLRSTLTSVTSSMQKAGDKKINFYIFEEQYINGCDYHPDVNEHKEIAEKVANYIKSIKGW
ncbi:MAG TPA: SGNH/GDSL hydrolase family protein [Chitinophagaceae bacterium]|nr:SGNH/GDSL hydrolase family protein [Chitinophagaceae bacterium]